MIAAFNARKSTEQTGGGRMRPVMAARRLRWSGGPCPSCNTGTRRRCRQDFDHSSGRVTEVEPEGWKGGYLMDNTDAPPFMVTWRDGTTTKVEYSTGTLEYGTLWFFKFKPGNDGLVGVKFPDEV